MEKIVDAPRRLLADALDLGEVGEGSALNGLERPEMAKGIADGMNAYLAGIPESLYALFGTGYLGYTAARAWGKAKGVER